MGEHTRNVYIRELRQIKSQKKLLITDQKVQIKFLHEIKQDKTQENKDKER